MDAQQDRLLDRLFTSFKDCSSKVENCLNFAESRHSDLKREMSRLTGVVEAAVPLPKFTELQLSLKAMKVQVETEMD